MKCVYLSMGRQDDNNHKRGKDRDYDDLHRTGQEGTPQVAESTCYSHQHPLTKQKPLCFYPFRSGKTDVGRFFENPIKIGLAAFFGSL